MKRFGVLIALALAVAAVPDVRMLRGQQPDTTTLRILLEQRLGRRVSQDEILEQLRQSGMSRDEARARLRERGFDPAIADYYYDQLEAGAGEQADADADFLRALDRIGLARAGRVEARDTVTQPGRTPVDSGRAVANVAVASAPADPLAYFGRRLFERSSTEFEPILVGPVPPDYRLGPGDEVVLVLTGDVQDAITMTVSRSGYLVLPNVGQVFVNGLTMGQLEDQLYDRLGSVYSGVRRDGEATTSFHVSLGSLRTIQVYIIGEVERPAAYMVSSVATVFNALYHAGGPSAEGSLRNIQVQRGGRVVQHVDLYDYLVHGDGRSDIRLEHGDRIFVPLAQHRVTVKGAVRRPAIYEVRQEEGLREVVGFAGGLEPDAFVRRVQIDRILSPDARQPGIERVLYDVSVESLRDEQGESIALSPGDVIEVSVVSEARRHRVAVMGEVRRPGTYEWREGTTLWGLIGQADGLNERAYTERAHIYRLNEADGSRRLIRTPLLADANGQPIGDVGLADEDSVVIYSTEELRNPAAVTIDGLVKKPGSYTLAEGMTLQDLIIAAGGFAEGANVLDAEVARLRDGVARADTTAQVMRVRLQSELGLDGAAGEETLPVVAADARLAYAGARRPAPGEVPGWRPGADELELRHGDRVSIRRAPGYQPARAVMVTGEVLLPGAYVLDTRESRLLSAIERAGGMTEQAYAEGLHIVRGGRVVAIDLKRARDDPRSGHNVMLEAGDSILVPAYDPTVVVTGAVNFDSRVLYQPGQGLDYYITQAGGYASDADPRRVAITYPNGEREDVGRVLGLFSSKPKPAPGSTIFVPAKRDAPPQGFSMDQFLARTTAIVSTLVAVILATRN